MKSSKRVLLDTSTLFSGLGWSGPPFLVLLKIHEGNFDLVLTDYILEELSDHFEDFPEERREQAEKSLEYLQKAHVISEEEWKENLDRGRELVGDSKDAPIMAAYLLEDIDILVTSDEKDFPVKDHENIMGPKEFLAKF